MHTLRASFCVSPSGFTSTSVEMWFEVRSFYVRTSQEEKEEVQEHEEVEDVSYVMCVRNVRRIGVAWSCLLPAPLMNSYSIERYHV